MASKKSAKNRGKPQQKATKPPAEEEMPLEIEEAPAVEVSDMKTAEKREKDKGKKKTGGAMAWIRKADPIAMTCFTVFILAFVVVTASYINTMYIAEPPAQHMIVNGDSVEVEYTGSYFAYYDKDGAVVFDTNVRDVDEGSYMKSPGYTDKDKFEYLDFTVGGGQMLELFEQALIGHTEGQTVRVQIPASQGYGEQAAAAFTNSVHIDASGSLSLDEFNTVFGTEYKADDLTNPVFVDSPFGFEVFAEYDETTSDVTFTYLGIEDVTEAKTLGLDSNVTYTVKADDDGTGFTVEYGFNEDADRMFEVLGSDYGADYVYKQNGSYVYRDVTDDDNAEQLGMTLYFVIKIVSVNA